MENIQLSIFDVANWFLSKKPMTPKKLQKLAYYTKAWGLALFDKSIVDSDFEAWTHGPVSQSLYVEYKRYGWNEIPQVIPFSPKDKSSFENEDIQYLLESIFITYGDKSGNELEALTHQEEPWIKARQRAGAKINDRCNEIISDDDMRDFYRSIYIGD